MTLSKKLTRRHLTVVALAVGMSLPLYAMADTTAAGNPVEVMAKTTTTTTKTVIHKHHHKAHAAAKANKESAAENAKALDAEAANGGAANKADTSQGTEKRVVWKNGVVFHDVEPSGQAASPFGAPTSTSDTLKGDVTTTPVAPQQQ